MHQLHKRPLNKHVEIKMTEVEIAVAHPDDLDGINNIRRRILADPSSPHKTPDIDVGHIEQGEMQITFIARNEAGTIGYLSLHSGTSLQDCGDADLQVFVLPGSQGRGVGTRLMTDAEEFVQSKTRIGRLTLGVMNANPRARELYVRWGFQSVSKDSRGETMSKDVKR